MDIKLNLTLDEINYILNALSSRPYIEVVELIEKIKTEGERQIAQSNYVAETPDNVEVM